MLANVQFQIVSFIYLIMTSFLFFGKKKIKNMDTTIYSILVVFNLILLVVDLASIYVLAYHQDNQFLVDLTCKGYLYFLVVWAELLTDYVYLNIWEKWNPKSHFILMITLFIIAAIIMYVLPLSYYLEDGIIYIEEGSYAVYAAYGIFGLCILSWAISVIIMGRTFTLDEIKKRNKKLYPIFSFVLFGSIALIIQRYFPQCVLSSSAATLVTILMYHTIENPDIDTMNEMDAAKREAQEANKAKSDFLSSMSHEIRTPLNAIIGFSNFIMDCDDLEDAKSNAKDVVSASQILLETVNGILDISKVESGKLEIINDNYNLNDLLDGTVKMTKARMGDKKLEFVTDFQKDLPESLYGDKSNINKIIINLLTNAVKYTNEGTINYSVRGTVTDDTCRLVISVKDTGIGIKKEDLDKLFTRFQRLDEKKNSSIEGTGLGMAITKQLVEMMGGSISVSSEYGKGSTFTVSLDQKISSVNVSSTQKEESEVAYNFSDKKVLVVDDNNLNLKLATRLFDRYSCKIETATSGFEAIDLIQNGNKYDIIFLDDVMPKMLGSETLTRIKSMEGFNTPVISLTANAIDGVREKYISLGFDDYLAKPIERPKLEEILVRFLVNKEEAKALDNEILRSSKPVELINDEVKASILNSPSVKMDNVKVESGDNMNDSIFETTNIGPITESAQEEVKPVEEVKEEVLTNTETTVQVDTVSSTTEVIPAAVSPVETPVAPVAPAAPSVPATPADDSVTDYSDKRVLIVDDNKLNLKVAAKFLDRYRFQINEASSGEECIEKVKSGEVYDIIFMDIMMPTMSGVDTLHELNSIEGFNIPIIVALTADAVEGAKEKYINEGFAEYISKPIVREHLDNVIHKILDK